MSFTSNSFAENSTLPQILPEDIPNNTLLYSNETKLFIPGCELHIDNNYVCTYVYYAYRVYCFVQSITVIIIEGIQNYHSYICKL